MKSDNGNGELPPFDFEAEAGALACVLSCSTREQAEKLLEQLNSDNFFDLKHRAIYQGLSCLQADRKPLQTPELCQHFKDSGKLEEVGGIAYLAQLPDQTPSPENFPTYLETVKDRTTRRAVLRDAAEISILARDHSIAASTLSDATRNLLHVYSQNGHNSERLLQERLFNPARRPPGINTVFSLNGVTICTPGNLTTITSAIKTGKSAVIGAMCASTMPYRENSDLLGFKSQNPENKAVIHFDSEQSPDDHWHHVDLTLRRAGIREAPPWFYSYCLTGLVSKKAKQCVIEAVRQASDHHPGIHSVFIDGYADLVNDVNDAEECNAFVAETHAMSIEYFCPINGVIHFNPGTEKSRGHLGSQLERKAETNLALEKDSDETTVIYSTKNRRSGIPKHLGPSFRFNTGAGMHLTSDNLQTSKDNEQRDRLRDVAAAIFESRPSMRRLDLETTVKDLMTVSPKTAERSVGTMVRLGVIKKSALGLYVLSKPVDGAVTVP